MKIERKYLKDNPKEFLEYFDSYSHNGNEDLERSRKIFEMYFDGIKQTTIAHHYSVSKQNIDCIIRRYANQFYYAKN